MRAINFCICTLYMFREFAKYMYRPGSAIFKYAPEARRKDAIADNRFVARKSLSVRTSLLSSVRYSTVFI